MPSFFDFMKRMVEGRPVFDNPDEPPSQPPQQSSSPAPPPEQKPSFDKGDQHSFPVVYVKRVSSRPSGNKLQVYGWIKNEWPEEIMLDKITLLNTKRELDSFLRGNEEREFLLYDGPRPTHEYHEAELDYKTQKEADYFRAIHDVKFDYHQEDKTYTIDDMHLRRPIRDIYG